MNLCSRSPHTLSVLLFTAILGFLPVLLARVRSGWSFEAPGDLVQRSGPEHSPESIGPTTNVLWKAPLPPGHSSPVLTEDRIFVTAVDERRRLLTICLDRKTGDRLWEREAPYRTLENIHRIGSYAQASPVTDGERIISFFGSCGLWCHDLAWQAPLEAGNGAVQKRFREWFLSNHRRGCP